MQTAATIEKSDRMDLVAFFGAQYILMASVVATMAYTLSTLV